MTPTEALFDSYMRDVRALLSGEEAKQLTIDFYERALAEHRRSLNSGALSADSQNHLTSRIKDLQTKLKGLGVETRPEVLSVAEPSVSNLAFRSQDPKLDKPLEPVSTEPGEPFELTGQYIDLRLWERIKSAKLAKRLDGASNPFQENFETNQVELRFPSHLPENHVVVAEVRGFGEYPNKTYPHSYAVICPNLEEMEAHYRSYASGNFSSIYFYFAPKVGSLPQS